MPLERFKPLITSTKENFKMMRFRHSFDQMIRLLPDSNIVIAPHRSSDDDCIFSALAMERMLQKYYPGRKTNIIVSERNPKRWDDLPGADKITWIKDEDSKKEITDYYDENSLVVFLDASTPDRFVSDKTRVDELAKFKNSVVIDHHENSSMNTTLAHVDIASAATGVLIAHIFGADRLDPTTSRFLAYAVYQDTVGFNVITQKNAHAFSLYEKLFLKGGFKSMKEFTSRFALPIELFPLIREFWSNSELVNVPIDGRTGCIYSYLKEVNPQDNLIQQAAHRVYVSQQERFAGMELFFVAYPTEENGVYRLSFRSKQKLNVASLCEACFGGTGHELAAGAVFRLNGEQMAELSKLRESADFNEMEYVTGIVLAKTVQFFSNRKQE